MIKLSFKSTALLLMLSLGVAGFIHAGTVFSQDYVDPSQIQDKSPDTAGKTPAQKKDIELETEYQKRLQEEIQRQLKAQQEGTAPEDTADDNNAPDDDIAADDNALPTDCGSMGRAVLSITEAAAKAKGGDASLKRQAGSTLTGLIKGVSEGFAEVPSTLKCPGGGQISNIEKAAGKEFETEFLQKCPAIIQAAHEAVKSGGILGFNRYIGSTVSDLSYTTLNTTIEKTCAKEGGSQTATNTSGSSNSGTGNQGTGSQDLWSSPLSSYMEDSNIEMADPVPQQSFPPIDAAHNDNPPNVSYGPDARWLALRSAHEADNYAKCVFSANNSVEQECKRKLDKVLWDRRQRVTQSIDAGTYLILHEICKNGSKQGCEEGGGSYIQINSGYRSPATNSSVGGATGSYHMKAKAVDFVIPGMSPSQSFSQCMRLAKGGCGKYSGFTHEDTGPHRSW